MATDLSLANRYAHSLSQSLMVPVTVFRSEAGYGVVTSDEFEGDPASVPCRTRGSTWSLAMPSIKAGDQRVDENSHLGRQAAVARVDRVDHGLDALSGGP
jgi:hypothetical protein